MLFPNVIMCTDKIGKGKSLLETNCIVNKQITWALVFKALIDAKEI